MGKRDGIEEALIVYHGNFFSTIIGLTISRKKKSSLLQFNESTNQNNWEEIQKGFEPIVLNWWHLDWKAEIVAFRR